ncbi:pyridoxal phosphate-dependent transferase [Pisolithus croceorrhizus]|nr:pyridoxal phosphate-dependent transferase [Pisolithus croceorrhizus]
MARTDCDTTTLLCTFKSMFSFFAFWYLRPAALRMIPTSDLNGGVKGLRHCQESVLKQAGEGLLDFQDTGIGIAEISHRSKEFKTYLQGVESDIKKLLKVPDSHAILFTQARHHELYPALEPGQRVMDYYNHRIVERQSSEGGKEDWGVEQLMSSSTRGSSQLKENSITYPVTKMTPTSSRGAPSLIYYCANETVDGVEFAREEGNETSFPFHLLPEHAPLVGDYSSSFMSHPIPRLQDHAIIYAWSPEEPWTLGKTRWRSMPHFPANKSSKVYDALKRGEQIGIFKSKVRDDSGSQMNVVFDCRRRRQIRPVYYRCRGTKHERAAWDIGVRVSLYNAVTEDQVQTLVDYMTKFSEGKRACRSTMDVMFISYLRAGGGLWCYDDHIKDYLPLNCQVTLPEWLTGSPAISQAVGLCPRVFESHR